VSVAPSCDGGYSATPQNPSCTAFHKEQFLLLDSTRHRSTWNLGVQWLAAAFTVAQSHHTEIVPRETRPVCFPSQLFHVKLITIHDNAALRTSGRSMWNRINATDTKTASLKFHVERCGATSASEPCQIRTPRFHVEPPPPRTAPFSVNCCYFRREFDDENCERTHSATAFVVTPTLEPSLSRPINVAEATVALKSAPATPNGPICALHPDHVRQSTAKFGAPTIDPKPPTPEMARTPPPPASRHNPGAPTLPKAPRTG